MAEAAAALKWFSRPPRERRADPRVSAGPAGAYRSGCFAELVTDRLEFRWDFLAEALRSFGNSADLRAQALCNDVEVPLDLVCGFAVHRVARPGSLALGVGTGATHFLASWIFRAMAVTRRRGVMRSA